MHNSGTLVASREVRIFGPPGCGKTTTIKRLVIEKCKEYGSESILIASFTKTAARQVVSQHLPIDDQQIGTLHAHTFRALDRPKLVNKAALEEWNRQYPTRPFADGFKALDLDDPYKDQDQSALQQGDTLLQNLNRYRGLLVERDTWPLSLQSFHDDWTAFKNSLDLLDFSDLIEICYFDKVPIPRGARVLFLDEAQDFSPLELALARQWGESCDEFYLAADDDQCQPGHALVSTTNRGAVPIADLNEHDLLRTFDRTGGSEFYGSKRKGYRFQKACRQYVGELHAFVLASGHSIEVTHNHHMMARWNARAVNAYCVYLMRKGRNWRVGTSQVVRGISGIFGPSGRARSEMADDLWILKIFDSSSMAVLEEDFIAAKYGVSRLVFEWQKSIRHSREALDAHHDRMCAIGQIARLLLDYGKYLDLPYWSRANRYKGRGCKAWQIIPAANCFATYMDMLTDVGKAVGVPSAIAEVKTSRVDIPVYSLNVEPYHTYVSGGIATHNCLYAFKGASPEAFLNPVLPPEQVRVLEQSYRVPRTVHALACAWVEQLTMRQPKAYRPRDYEGVVDRIPITYKYLAALQEPLNAWLKAGKTVALLASCSYMIDPVKHQLRAWGIPYHNPWRRCSPPDEPVLTDRGWVQISDLDPMKHRLAGFHAHTNALSWGGRWSDDLLSHTRSGVMRPTERRGFNFSVGKRPYSGEMITLTTSQSRTRVTPNHRMKARYAKEFYEKWAVYLMRRGKQWRVGMSHTGHFPFLGAGIGGRLTREGADAAWILSIHRTRSSAILTEAGIHARYGITGLTFVVHPNNKKQVLTQYELDAHHAALEDISGARAQALLSAFGLEAEFPLFVRDGMRRRRTGVAFDTVAANLMTGYMEIPVIPDIFESTRCERIAPEWHTVHVSREKYQGDVYSLDVPGPEYYVSGRAVVHNSRGDWNPLIGKQDSVSAAQRVLAYLRPSRNAGWWTYQDLWNWAGVIEADPIFTHGAKTAIRRKAEDELTGLLPVETRDLDAWIADAQAPHAAISGDVAWYQAHLLKSAQKPIAYACAIVEACGVEALTKVPQVTIGTVHSVKGGEAEIVILFPDLSRAGFEQWVHPGSRDSIVRCFYVGITRAREALYWADPVGPTSISGYL